MKLKKQARRDAIVQLIAETPFMTDQELSRRYEVSIQTIRLDRAALGIPELRKRVKTVAEHNYNHIKSLHENEVIGDVIQVEPNQSAQSLVHITEDAVFTRNKIARGHILFAQANSLCVAVLQHDYVLTQSSQVVFLKQVKLGEAVHAYATVVQKTEKYYIVEVASYVAQDCVFQGTFKMYYISEDE